MESNEVITTNGKILRIEALQSEVDALKGTVTLLVDMLSKKVDKDDVVNQINLSEEGIRIGADKISINGETMIAERKVYQSKSDFIVQK